MKYQQLRNTSVAGQDLLTQARLPEQQKISLKLTKPYGSNQNSAFWKNHITGRVRFLGQEQELYTEVNGWLSFSRATLILSQMEATGFIIGY